MLLETISLEYHESLLATAGPGLDLARTTAMERYPDGYIAVVEGAIPDGADGAYCLVGGRPVADIVREVCDGRPGRRSRWARAPATAAPRRRAGGLTDAKGIRGLVGDTKLITLPGCPMNVGQPDRGDRPLPDVQGVAGPRHDGPAAGRVRQPHPQPVRAAPALRVRRVRPVLGRRGGPARLVPVQGRLQGPRGDGQLPDRPLRRRRQLEHPRRGTAASAASTTDFWDQMGPAYRRLPSPVPFFPNLTTDMVGAAVVGGVAVVAGVHAVGMGTRYKRRARNARREALATAEGVASPRMRSPWTPGEAGPAADAVAVDSTGGRDRPRMPRRPKPRPTRPPTDARRDRRARRDRGALRWPGSRSTPSPASAASCASRPTSPAAASPGRGPPPRCSGASRRSCRGRDPRDAWLLAQRICGTCNGVHAARVGARRGAGARHPDPDQRPPDPQRPRRHAVRARPRHDALPGEPPGLGGHERGRRPPIPWRPRGSPRRAAPGRTPARRASAMSGTASPPSSRRNSRDRSPRRGPAIRPTASPPSRACCSWPTCSRRSTGSATSRGSRRCSRARRPTRRPTSSAGCRWRRPGAARRPRRRGSIRRSRTATRPSR